VLADAGRAGIALAEALARMSGSGATIFGLCLTPEAADAAAAFLTRSHPRAWVRSTSLAVQ